MSFLTSHMLHLVIICSIQVARVHSMSINRNMKTGLLYGALPSLYNQFGNSISSFLVVYVYSHDRTSSITRVHTTTWDYFSGSLAYRFTGSSEVIMGEIMTDINDLVQEFWTSSNEAVGPSFFAMRRLLGILQKGFELVVCFAFLRLLSP